MLFIANVCASEAAAKNELIQHRRKVRNNTDPLALSNEAFIDNFRLSKSIFLHLLEGLRSQLDAKRNYGITTPQKLAACLIFFGTGSYQRGVGKDFHVAIAQSTFSKILQQTLLPLHTLISDWVNLAMSEEELLEAKEYFFQKSGFENIVMCVDGTHIKIKKPRYRPLLYLNRKNVYSINAMIVCDHKYRIRAIDARFAGSHHDAHIWRVSPVREYFEEIHRSGRNDRLLGDAGYSSEPWLVRPHRDPDEGSEAAEENTRITAGRIIVEQTIGILKSRFRCLLGADRCLNYDPKKSGLIINTCSALHNMCIEHNIAWQKMFNDMLHDMEYS